MNTIIFNFHDVLMVLTAFECLLFAILLGATNKEKHLSNYFLVGFLLAHVLITLHELTFWGSQFRIWLLNHSPNYFFIGSYAYFLDGCLLYFFVRAMLFKDFALKKHHLWHLLPIAFYLCWMIFIFYSKDYSQRYWLIESQHIAYSSPYLYLESAGRYLRLVYALLCFALVFNYSKQLQHVYANLKMSDLAWLKVMLVSFVLLFAWDSILLSIKLFELFEGRFDLDLLNVVGLSGYYLNFAVINILIFLKFILFSSVQSVDEAPAFELKEEKVPAVDPQSISMIEQVMTEKKYYANPDITLDKLAAEVKLHPKKLSLIFKLHYQLNFYQFVNRYRINEAKQLLTREDYADKTITDIYLAVGFNNKSVFNSFFKRSEGITPSEYRDRILRSPGKSTF